MATITFDKEIFINDDKTMDVLLKGLNKQYEKKECKKIDVVAELERSSSILKRLYSRSRK